MLKDLFVNKCSKIRSDKFRFALCDLGSWLGVRRQCSANPLVATSFETPFLRSPPIYYLGAAQNILLQQIFYSLVSAPFRSQQQVYIIFVSVRKRYSTSVYFLSSPFASFNRFLCLTFAGEFFNRVRLSSSSSSSQGHFVFPVTIFFFFSFLSQF